VLNFYQINRDGKIWTRDRLVIKALIPCQKTISSIQKLKLLGEVPGYDLYYSLTHPLKWKPFGLEICINSFYLVFNFYEINGDGEIWTRDRLVIKTLIPCQRTISSIQKLKVLGEVLGYDLYYSLTHLLKWKPFELEICINPFYLVLNFYQINGDGEIRTRDRLVIKALIPCQRTISTQ
jgi:hypothetical protein